MEFAVKAALINIFGDEWGAGEAWDLYEMYTSYDKFKKVVVYVIASFFVVVGAVCLVVGFYENSNEIFLGIGGFLIGLAMVMVLVAVIHHMYHKKAESGSLLGSVGGAFATAKSGLHTLSNLKKHGVTALL